MELRRYWNVIWRRLPIVLALPLLVGLGSTALFLTRPVSYTAKTNVQLTLLPLQANDPNFFRYDNYYKYLSTEYAADDLVEVMNGNVFTDEVARTLQGPDFNLTIGKEQIRGALDVTRKHRVIQIASTTSHRDWSMAIGKAAVLTLQRDPMKYFSHGGAEGPSLAAAPITIDQPLEARGNRAKGALNVALQTAVALFAGLALAFLLEYLDDRLRSPEAVRETLGLPVLGAIPGGAADGRAPAAANGRRAA